MRAPTFNAVIIKHVWPHWSGSELSRTCVERKQRFFVKILRKQRANDGNEVISMNPNNQCRLCNCGFKEKFIFLIRLKGWTSRMKFFYVCKVFKSRIFDPRGRYLFEVKAQLHRMPLIPFSPFVKATKSKNKQNKAN